MRFDYELEYEDFVAAQKLYRKRSIRQRFFRLLLWLLGAMEAAGLYGTVAFALHGDMQQARGGLRSCSFILLILAVFWGTRWFNVWMGYRNLFRRNPLNHRAYLRLDEKSVVSGFEASGESRLKWEAIKRFSENDQVALLHLSEKQFVIVPKNKFRPQDWTEAKRIILQHVSKR